MTFPVASLYLDGLLSYMSEQSNEMRNHDVINHATSHYLLRPKIYTLTLSSLFFLNLTQSSSDDVNIWITLALSTREDV